MPAAGSTTNESLARLEAAMRDGFQELKEDNQVLTAKINKIDSGFSELLAQNKQKDDEYLEQVKIVDELRDKLNKANKKIKEQDAIVKNVNELEKKYEELKEEEKSPVVDWRKERANLLKRLQEKEKIIEDLKIRIKELEALFKIKKP